MKQECIQLVADQPNIGVFIDRLTAQGYVNDYLADAGTVQPPRNDNNHVFGFLFGLNVLKQFIMQVDMYNVATEDSTKQITGVRIYRAKSTRTGDKEVRQDLVLVPVMRTGEDYPIGLMQLGDFDKMYLASSGPCPNICNTLYFL